MFCPKCGKETPDGAQFCLHCGFPIGAFLQGGRTDLNPPPAQAPMQTPIQDPVQTPIQAPAEPVSPQIQPEEPAQRAFPGQQPAAEQQTANEDFGHPAFHHFEDANENENERKPQRQEDARKTSRNSKTGRGGRLPLPLILGAAALVIIGIILAVVLSGPKYEVNDPDLEAVTPIDGYDAASSKDLALSFLYPSGSLIRDNGSRGIYVYPSGTQGLPYIQVTASKNKAAPDKYFSDYQKQLKKDYSDAEFDDVRKVPISEKTLYMQRAFVFNDGADQVVDRYIEIYPSQTVEYTVKSLNAGSEDHALAAISESLRTRANVYTVSGSASGSGSGSGSGSEPATIAESVPSTVPETVPATIPSTEPATIPPATIAETEPPATIAAPVPSTVPSGGGSSGGSTGGSGGGSTGGGSQNPDDYQIYTSQSGGFAFMVDKTLVSSVTEITDGFHIRLKAYADDEDADITVKKNNLSSEGITTADQFLEAYISEMVAQGAARPQIYDMGGGYVMFKGITSTYTDDDFQLVMYLFAADDGKGNVYTIYFENFPELVDGYTLIVNGIFATFMVM